MNAQDLLDRTKLLMSRAILEQANLNAIRDTSLANLQRWKSRGVWCSAYDEWTVLMTSGRNEDILAAMTGLDKNSNRLRQSPPYVGIISQEARQHILDACFSGPLQANGDF
jgi:hypothetical protein